jgi:hypothetical protein
MLRDECGRLVVARFPRAACKSPSQEIAEDEGDEKAETALYPAQEERPGAQERQVEDIQQEAEEGKKNRCFLALGHGRPTILQCETLFKPPSLDSALTAW